MSDQLEKINAVVGFEACLALAAAYGGLDVYLPERITAAHPIAILIGKEKAQVLSVWMAGRKLRVPVAKHFVDLRNARTALDMQSRGFSLGQIAQTLNVSQPTASRLLKLACTSGLVDMQKKWKPKLALSAQNTKNDLL